MKNKSIIIGLVVYGAGVATGYAITIKKLKSKFREDVAAVKDFYSLKLEELGVMGVDFSPESMIVEEEEVPEEDEYEDEVEQYSSAATTTTESKGKLIPRTNYNKPPLQVVAHGLLEQEDDEDEDYPDDPEDEFEDEAYQAALEARADEFAQRRLQNESNGRPYVISYEEAMELPDEYERVFLYYYSEDRFLCEDNDDLVEDEEELLGLDYEDVLEMQTGAWVRNDSIMVVYEITRIDDSYERSVKSLAETPREREYRINGRRKQGMEK